LVLGLCLLQALLLLLLLRQQGRLLLRLEALEVPGTVETGDPTNDNSALGHNSRGLAVGTHAPGFRLASVTGELVSMEAVFGSKEFAFLIFTNPKCGPCLSLMPDVRRWEQQFKSIRLVLISEGTLDDNSQKITRFGASLVLLQQKREVAEAYLANGTPAAVVIRNGGTIASPLAFGADAVRSLFERLSIKVEAVFQNGNGVEGGINNRSEVLPGSGGTLKVGDQAPSLEFLDTNARHVSFSSFRGKKTLLIFWNPGCHFCQEMLIRLRALETEMVPDNGNLALISSGKASAHQEMGLRSTILLDENLTASTAFGARGTPTAVLLSAEGIITSDVLIGPKAF
jgi:peroxiredoxin